MGASKLKIHSNEVIYIAELAKAIAHPARVSILNYIASSKGCLCKDIAAHIKLSQPTTSQHLLAIKKTGLLDVEFIGNGLAYKINRPKLREVEYALFNYFEAIGKNRSESIV